MANPPLISPLPPAPTPADSPSDFNRKAFAFVIALDSMRAQMNALATWMNTFDGTKWEPVAMAGTSLTLSDENFHGRYLRFYNPLSKVIICPGGADPAIGSQSLIGNANGGDITLSAGAGVTINGNATISSQEQALLIKVLENQYDLIRLSSSGSGGGMENPMTDEGDLILGGSGGAPTRLPKGSELQVLTIKDGAPVWEYPQLVLEDNFEVYPGSAYAWSGFPVTGSGGDGYFAGGGTINNGPFYDGSNVSPGTVLDYSGIGVGFVQDVNTNAVWFILVLPGSTGDEIIEITGIPYYSSRTTNTASYGYNSVIGQNVFAWDMGPGAFIPGQWHDGESWKPMTIRRIS